MTVDINYRQMHIEDLEEVHRLETQIFPTPWALKSFRFEIEQNSVSDPWVAYFEDNNSETILGYIVPWLLIDEIHVANIAVDPAFRKQGIARQLLMGALMRAADLGVNSAILEVRASNLPAQRLYRSFNFEILARRKNYYKDNGEDAVIMRLENIKDNLSMKQAEAA